MHDGETVVDVPAKLSASLGAGAGVRYGNGRKTGPVAAHSVAMAAFRPPGDPGLVPVLVDDDLVVMGRRAVSSSSDTNPSRRVPARRVRSETVYRTVLPLAETHAG